MPEEARAADRPATFGEVFASREYRYLFSATLLSWFGDYLAKAAVTALIFAQTRSVALSAAAFALSYLPWVAGVRCWRRSPNAGRSGASWSPAICCVPA